MNQAESHERKPDIGGASMSAEAQAPALLFVDDEANILSSLRRLFRPLGYRIFTAPGGSEGLGILEREKINLIISDMRMPEMDGAAFLAKSAEKWPNIEGGAHA